MAVVPHAELHHRAQAAAHRAPAVRVLGQPALYLWGGRVLIYRGGGGALIYLRGGGTERLFLQLPEPTLNFSPPSVFLWLRYRFCCVPPTTTTTAPPVWTLIMSIQLCSPALVYSALASVLLRRGDSGFKSSGSARRRRCVYPLCWNKSESLRSRL